MPGLLPVQTTSGHAVAVAKGISEAYGVPWEVIISRAQGRRVSPVRHLIFWTLREMRTDGKRRYTLHQVARIFGASHSTVVLGVRSHEVRRVIHNLLTACAQGTMASCETAKAA